VESHSLLRTLLLAWIATTALYVGPSALGSSVDGGLSDRGDHGTAANESLWVSALDSDYPPADPRSLLQKAQEDGPLPVIVMLRAAGPDVTRIADAAFANTHRQQLYAAQTRVLDRLSIRPGRETAHGVKRFEVTPGFALEATWRDLIQLEVDPDVLEVIEDVAYPPLLAQSVPLIGGHVQSSFLGRTGQGQTIAVIDTGVDKFHPFFPNGKVASEACYSTASFNTTSLCPGGVTQSTAPGSGLDCNTTISGCGHGTHVAGIAAGSGDNFSGVAKDASIIALKVFSRTDSSIACSPGAAPCVLAYTSDIAKGLERVFALRNTYSIAAANMSLGGGQYFAACDFDPLKPVIDSLRAAGIATVIASGNNSYVTAIGAPACISTAVSVGSTTKQDEVSPFSNSASFLDLLAPGSSINSSVPGTGFALKSGTSMAAPHVAGAWAVLKESQPGASVDAVLNALTSTGLPVTDYRPGANNRVKPRIRVDQAVGALSGNLTLTVTRAGTGSGTVTSVPAGIDCGSACSASFNPGVNVTLSATAYSGSTFAGWSGEGCSGTGTCSVSMTQARSVTATFNSVGGISLGQALDNTSLSWPTGGSANWYPQTNVWIFGGSAAASGTITHNQSTWVQTSVTGPGILRYRWRVSSEANYDFLSFYANDFLQQRWISGEVNWTQQSWNIPAGTYTLRWEYEKDITISSGLDRGWLDQVEWIPATSTFPLTVSKGGTGSGMVISAPEGIDCGSICSASFNSGANVTLYAIAGSGSTFAGWSGACIGTGTCTVNMTEARNVTATFDALPATYALSVSKTGTGTGTVTSTPSGIDCGSACSASFNSGASVTLYATAGSGSTFSGWSGACIGTGTCTVNMTEARSVAATFNEAAMTAQVVMQKYYIAYYGRPADPAGLDFWVQAIEFGALSFEDAIAAFGASAEFDLIYGSDPTPEDFFTAAYLNVLNRAPDLAGLEFWLGVYASYIGSGMSAGEARAQLVIDVVGGIPGGSPVDQALWDNKLNLAEQTTDLARDLSHQSAAALINFARDGALKNPEIYKPEVFAVESDSIYSQYLLLKDMDGGSQVLTLPVGMD
jgi:hypothetical protein